MHTARAPPQQVSLRLAGATGAAVGLLCFVTGYQLALGRGGEDCARGAPPSSAVSAAAAARAAPALPAPASSGALHLRPAHWSDQAHEEELWRAYGPYARVAFTNWGRRTHIIPPERRAEIAAAKRDLLTRYKEKVTSSYLATVGDFEMEWALGLMAPANSTLIELGTCHGWGAIVIATAMRAAGNGARLWSVDLYDKGHSVKQGWCAGVKLFTQRMGEWGVGDIVTPKCCSSVEVAASIPDGTLDGVFVDADHTFNAVYQDVSTWWPKLVPDGLMLGHDGFSHKNNKIVQNHIFQMADFFDRLVAGRDMMYHNPMNSKDVGSQGAEVSTGAMKFALPTLKIEYSCCMLNSSIWYYRRLPEHLPLVSKFGNDGFKQPGLPTWPTWA